MARKPASELSTRPADTPTSRARRARPTKARPEGTASSSPVISLAQQLQVWASSLLDRVGEASDTALKLAAARTREPGPKAAFEKTAALLRDLRQAAGLSLEDLGRALELEDPGFIGQVESGKAALPFDLILRLASVLARNDPMGFVMRMTRTYNPKLWKALEGLGVGKLLVHAGREREFANIYRRHDAARQLSDKDFATALAFTEAAFEAALAFQHKHKRGMSETHATDASRATGHGPPT